MNIADKERKLIWPNVKQDYPDIFVSIGTTYSASQNPSPETTRAPRMSFFLHGKTLDRVAIDHVASALDAERTWHAYMAILEPPPYQRRKYYRINPRLGESPPGLDDVKTLEELQEKALELVDTNQIANLAAHVTAANFYFETTRIEPVKGSNDSKTCKGKRGTLCVGCLSVQTGTPPPYTVLRVQRSPVTISPFSSSPH